MWRKYGACSSWGWIGLGADEVCEKKEVNKREVEKKK